MSSAAAPRIAGSTLASVPLLAGLPPEALDELARECAVARFDAGERIVGELETGEEALILLEVKGRVTVGGLSDERPMEIGEVGPGDCVGEMALFTGELRSATVEAKSVVSALVLSGDRFTALMARHPQIGEHLAGKLAERLRDADRVLATVLDPKRTDAERREALRRSRRGAGTRKLRVAVQIAWAEAVASHRRELPFLMLLSFIGALALIRSAILLERHLIPDGPRLEELLRTGYIGGLLLMCGSGIASLLWFRPNVRRATACLFGAGMALLFNALPVLLTFDLYYRDIFTPDPSLKFDVETLYARSEGAHVVFAIAAFLLQMVYLQRFYRRLLTMITLRAAKRLGM